MRLRTALAAAGLLAAPAAFAQSAGAATAPSCVVVAYNTLMYTQQAQTSRPGLAVTVTCDRPVTGVSVVVPRTVVRKATIHLPAKPLPQSCRASKHSLTCEHLSVPANVPFAIEGTTAAQPQIADPARIGLTFARGVKLALDRQIVSFTVNDGD